MSWQCLDQNTVPNLCSQILCSACSAQASAVTSKLAALTTFTSIRKVRAAQLASADVLTWSLRVAAGLPVFSVYAKSQAQIVNIVRNSTANCLVFDIQDAGVRYYT